MGRAAASGTGRVLRFGGHVFLLGWLATIVVPIVILLLATVRSNNAIYADPLSLDLGGLRLGNYGQALQGAVGARPLSAYLLNSLLATVLSLGIGLVFGTLAAYGLSRSGPRATVLFTGMFAVLITIPILVTLIPIFDMLGTFGLRNNTIGISLVYAAFMIPPTALLMRPHFAAVPLDLIEAAELDGAGETDVFRRVMLPITLPSLGGVALLNLLWVWSELAFAIVLLVTPASKTLPVGLLAFQGEHSTDIGVQMAGFVMAIAPMVAIYLVFSRRLTDGIGTGGAMK